MKEKISTILLSALLGLFLGAVFGSVIDNLLGINILSKNFHPPLALEFYIIKIEVGLTPAALVGMVVTSYFMIRKG